MHHLCFGVCTLYWSMALVEWSPYFWAPLPTILLELTWYRRRAAPLLLIVLKMYELYFSFWVGKTVKKISVVH